MRNLAGFSSRSKFSVHFIRLLLALAAVCSVIWFHVTDSRVPAHDRGATTLKKSNVSVTRELSTENKARINETLGKSPMSFEANKGQVNDQVKFLSRGPGYTLFLTQTEAVLSLRPGKKEPKSRKSDELDDLGHLRMGWGAQDQKPDVLRMKLVESNPAPRVVGQNELPAKINYFIGNDRSRWGATSSYESVKYQNVYEGIDLIYYGNQRNLEYDFIIAPNSDPSVIRVSFEGAKEIKIEDGELVLHMPSGEVRQHQPVIYQESQAGRQRVDGKYIIQGTNQIGFAVAEYDHSLPLIIDPELVYSTLITARVEDVVHFMEVDAAGNMYLAGSTDSEDFPTKNAYLSDPPSRDYFVMKLDPTRSGADSLIYSTYLGGSNSEEFFTFESGGFGVDAAGCAYLTGRTSSPDYPTKNGYQNTHQFSFDVVVTKLDPNQLGPDSLIYSTYLGGSGPEESILLELGATGTVFIAGMTRSSNFPTKNGLQGDQVGQDLFLTKLDTNRSGDDSLLYSTYLGGSNQDILVKSQGGLVVDSAGDVYLSGNSPSPDFPIKNGLPAPLNQGRYFLVKIDPTQTGEASLIYSTKLAFDLKGGLVVDSLGCAYLTGSTYATDLPVKNGYQSDQPGMDIYVVKLDPHQSGEDSLIYSTYFGGGEDDSLDSGGLALDSANNLYLVGTTSSANLPVRNGIQGFAGGGVYIAKFDLNQSGDDSLLYSTYLGGSGSVGVEPPVVNGSGILYLAGVTGSGDFPIKDPIQTYQGDTDRFVAMLDTNRSGADSLLFSSYLGGSQNDRSYRFYDGLAIDPAGNIYVAGLTNSNDFPNVNGLSGVISYVDIFAAKISVGPAALTPDLTTALSHSGDFIIGSQGVYTITVGNAANRGPVSGTITVTDILPGNLTLAGYSGAGWTCNGIGTADVICTNSAGLAAGSVLADLILTVNVGPGTPTGANSITNTATVSIAPQQEYDITNNSSSDPTTVNTLPAITIFGVTRQEGAPSANSTIANVSDVEDSSNTLAVKINGDASATVNGVTVSNISVDSLGVVRADVVAACGATNAAFTLTVTDSGSSTTTGALDVVVTPNSPPSLVYPSPVSVPNGNGAIGRSITPTVAGDNGSITGFTVASNLNPGDLSVNQTTGVVTINKALSPGSYPVTVNATDNCGATKAFTFNLIVNRKPTITSQVVSQQQGSLSPAPIIIANVSDAEDPESILVVTANGGASATVNGVTLSNISVDSLGVVKANLVAACGATSAVFTLTVTDSGGLSANSPLTVTVSLNTPPTLGNYRNTTIRLGTSSSATVAPSVPPSDNSVIVSITAFAPDFSGLLSVNPTTGVVTITNAGPTGNYKVKVTATDNCGATTTDTFSLKVNP